MRYKEKFLISCGIVLLVTACASPDSLPPPTHEEVVQEALPETTEIAVTWGEFTTEGSVQDGWIATFNDQKLVQIVDEVLKNNRDIAVAAANVTYKHNTQTQTRTNTHTHTHTHTHTQTPMIQQKPAASRTLTGC